MSMNRNRRISARAAEDLLNGASADGRHTHVAALLRTAAGPGRPDELAGQQQALMAFHRAQLRPDPSPRRQSMIKSALVKVLTVKAAAVAALVLAGGGVALAASTGALPNPLSSHQPATATSSSGHPDSSHGPTATPHPGGSADPSPSLVGLCRAYTAGAGSAQGKALDNPAFHALLTAAGGKDNVDSYCTNLLATTTTHPTGSPSDHPSGRPSTHPTGRPSSHPTGNPSGHPTGHPSGNPTGNPTPKPSH
jgi:hypothetical protein